MNISKEEFIELIKGGTWFRTHKSFLKIMSTREAIMLSFLLNQLELTWNRANEGWFPFSRSLAESEIGYEKHTQRRSLLALAELGFVKETTGEKGERLIKVNLMKVAKTMLNRGLENATPGSHKCDPGGLTNATPLRAKTRGETNRETNTERPAREARRVFSSSSVGGFFGTKKSQDHVFAERLHGIIVKAGKLQRKDSSLHNWAEHFFKLRTEDKETLEDITQVLDHYEKVIGQKYIPEAYSGKSFREKFPQLKRSFERTQQEKPEVEELSPTIVSIIQAVRDMNWPKDADRQIPKVVRESYHNYVAFLKRHDEWYSPFQFRYTNDVTGDYTFKGPNKLRNVVLVPQLIEHLLARPGTFLVRWFDQARKQVEGWSSWNGNLSQYVFTPTHRMFDAHGVEAVSDYFGTPDNWYKYLTYVNEG